MPSAMPSAMPSVMLLVLTAVVSLVAVPVHAQSKAERQAARALGVEALKLYERKDYAAAYDRFDKANRLLQAPTLELYMARCQLGLGKLATAYEHFRRGADTVLDDDAPRQFVKAQQQARAALAELEPKVPTVQVTVQGPPAGQLTVRIDGQPSDLAALGERLRLDPGEHSVEASAPGFETAAATIALSEGATETVLLSLEPAADGATSNDGALWPAFIAYGIGAASLSIGIVTGAMAASKADDIKSRCVDQHCPPEDEELGDEAELLASVSTVGFVVAGLGAVTGIALTLWRPGGAERGAEPSAMVKLGPGYVGLVGTF